MSVNFHIHSLHISDNFQTQTTQWSWDAESRFKILFKYYHIQGSYIKKVKATYGVFRNCNLCFGDRIYAIHGRGYRYRVIMLMI